MTIEEFFKKQTLAIGFVFIFLDIIVLLTILFSVIFLIPYYLLHIVDLDLLSGHSWNLQNFVLVVTPVIEFVLFIAILAIIHIGIYISIITPILIKSDLILDQLMPEIIKYLGLPFLTVVGSLLSVTMLNIVMILFQKIYINDDGMKKDEIVFHISLIIGIVIAILGLAILIRTEHSILESEIKHSTSKIKDDKQFTPENDDKG